AARPEARAGGLRAEPRGRRFPVARREADPPLLPSRSAGGLGGCAPEGARAHLASAEGRDLSSPPDGSAQRARPVRDDPDGGRPVLTVTVGALLETSGPDLGLALVAGGRGLSRPIALPRLQQPGLALAGFLPQLHPDRVQVHGLGTLILGKSGIGKSEAALDLVTHGHRLVADDIVIVRRISPTVLRGRAAERLSHHMEIRGLGIIDVEALFGTLATLDERQLDLVVELVEWTDTVDRLGLVEERYTLLELPLPMVRIPVRPGRSMALLIE